MQANTFIVHGPAPRCTINENGCTINGLGRPVNVFAYPVNVFACTMNVFACTIDAAWGVVESGQTHPERRSRSGSRVHPDAPAVRGHQGGDDGQSEAAAAGGAVAARP